MITFCRTLFYIKLLYTDVFLLYAVCAFCCTLFWDFRKIVQNGQTEPKHSFGEPEGVQRYAERRSLFIA